MWDCISFQFRSQPFRLSIGNFIHPAPKSRTVIHLLRVTKLVKYDVINQMLWQK